MRRWTPVDPSRRRSRQSHRAEAAHGDENGDAGRERQPGPAGFGAIVGQGGRRREHHDRNEGEAPDADHRRALRQRQRIGQRVAEGVPGKAGQDVTAQPFRGGKRNAERQETQRAPDPQGAGQRDAERGEEREHRRQADDRDRQQPAEGRRIDQKGIADPIKADEKIAEAEPPADAGRRGDAAPAAGSGAVDQPHHGRKGQEQHRPEIQRRHRQCRRCAGGEGDQPTPPAPGQYDGMNEPLRLHGGGGELELGRLASSRGAGRGVEFGVEFGVGFGVGFGTGFAAGFRNAVNSRVLAVRRSLLR